MNVKADDCSESFMNFPGEIQQVLSRMSERPAGTPTGEKLKVGAGRKKKDTSLPPLKYSLLDDVKHQIR